MKFAGERAWEMQKNNTQRAVYWQCRASKTLYHWRRERSLYALFTRAGTRTLASRAVVSAAASSAPPTACEELRHGDG